MSAETCPVVSLKISHSTCLQILKTRHLQTWKLDDKHVRWMWWNRILLECQKHMECSPRRLPVWVYQWFAETLCAQNLIVVMGCVASMLLFTTLSTWSFWLVFGTWRCHQAKKKKTEAHRRVKSADYCNLQTQRGQTLQARDGNHLLRKALWTDLAPEWKLGSALQPLLNRRLLTHTHTHTHTAHHNKHTRRTPCFHPAELQTGATGGGRDGKNHNTTQQVTQKHYSWDNPGQTVIVLYICVSCSSTEIPF